MATDAETGLSSLVLRTPRGYLVCSTEANGLITVEMGRPLTGWRDVPLAEALTLALPLPGAGRVQHGQSALHLLRR